MSITRNSKRQTPDVLAVKSVLGGELRRSNGTAAEIAHPEILRRPTGDDAVTFSNSSVTFSIIGAHSRSNLSNESYYTLILSREKLDIGWNNAKGSGHFSGICGIIVPPYTYCRMASAAEPGTLYIASLRPGDNDDVAYYFDSPIGFSIDNIKKHLTGLHPIELMVPANLYDHDILEGGQQLLSNGKRNIILGPKNMEVSAAGPASKQDLHLHKNLYEIYVAFDPITIFYATKEGTLGTVEASDGDAIIVKPGTPHYALMHGSTPTFVILGSEHPIIGDKEVISPHDRIDTCLRAVRG